MAPSDKMRQSPLGWPLGGGVGWRAGVWAGRPGGGVASAPALPRSQQLGDAGKRLPLLRLRVSSSAQSG